MQSLLLDMLRIVLSRVLILIGCIAQFCLCGDDQGSGPPGVSYYLTPA